MDKSTADYYFDRYAWPEELFGSWIPPADTEMIVVLPSFEEKETHVAVQSLINCETPKCHVVILVVINQPENASEETKRINKQTQTALENLSIDLDWLTMKTVQIDLPLKKAGVGLARKVGMDQAARWFHKLRKNGIIICFDADSICSTNYLQAIRKAYESDQTRAAILYYEHPLNPASGVIEYELHLRYYVDALRFAEYPLAFQTLGSCITVSQESYIQVGGMNTRKAGEDFYFLHKLAPLGGLVEINNATIYPSDRLSDRVPFGTGKALADFQTNGKILTYTIQPFIELKEWFARTDEWISKDIKPHSEHISQFLEENKFHDELLKMRKESKSKERFRQLYFQWWNGLRVLKYIHYRRDQGESMIPPDTAITQLNEIYWTDASIPTNDSVSLLKWIREKDRVYIR